MYYLQTPPDLYGPGYRVFSVDGGTVVVLLGGRRQAKAGIEPGVRAALWQRLCKLWEGARGDGTAIMVAAPVSLDAAAGEQSEERLTRNGLLNVTALTEPT